MVLKCKKHPTYKARRQPRSDCDRCWLRWLRSLTHHLGVRITMLEAQAQYDREQEG
jgi:hypothetical protein